MNEEQAIEIIRKELLSEESLLVKLSLKSGIDEQAVERLENAIRFLTDLYKNQDRVPKIVASAFVDLTPHFDRAMPLYAEDMQNKIFDLKERIVALGSTLLEG